MTLATSHTPNAPEIRRRPVSVSTAAYDGYDLDFAIADIADCGAEWIELAYIKGYVPFDESAFSAGNAAFLSSRLAAGGLKTIAVSAHLDLGEQTAPDALRRRIDFCARLGARVLITNSSDFAHRSGLIETLEAALPDLTAANIVLALENPGHGKNSLLPDGKAFPALLSAFNSPFIAANYDIGNAFTYNRETRDPIGDLRAALPHAVHVHAKDIRSDGRDWTFTAIGDGSLPYAGLIGELNAADPDLPIGVELPLRLDRSGRRDPERRPERVPLPDIRAAVKRSLAFFSRNAAAR